jgi:hypothetical protein
MNENLNPMSRVSPQQFPEVPVRRAEHQEGMLARLIEQQTAKVPSDWFLLAAIAAMSGSLLLEVRGRSRLSRFVGMWPTPLLTMGIYNKLVKLLGPR